MPAQTTTPTTNNPGTSFGTSGIEYIDALLGGVKWGGARGTAATVTFSIPNENSVWSPGYTDPVTDFYALNDTQKAAFRQALQRWADVANITFVEVSETSTAVGDIRVGFSGTVEGDGHAYYPAGTGELDSPNTGDVWISTGYRQELFLAGDNQFDTFVHELGHAIGLKHPFDEGVTLPTEQDNYRYSDMSYTRPDATRFVIDKGAAAGSGRFSTEQIYPEGPMLYDIAAAQWIYGPNTSHATGDDTYSFTAYKPFLKSLWDADGNDTIDASNMPGRQIINLNEGAFSSIGLTTSGLGWVDPSAADDVKAWLDANPTIPQTLYTGIDNLSIAYGAVIENATGGAENDLLTGNAAANRLIGGAGNDTLNGGTGDDTLKGGGGNDSIDGGGGTDTVQISGSMYQYRLGIDGHTLTVSSVDGQDTLTGVEKLVFDQGSVDVASLSNGGSANAIYRFYNAATNTHFYTNNVTERDSVLNNLSSFYFEGVAFDSTGSTGSSVFRFFNVKTGTHFYTISETERDAILANLPQYQFEGEAYKASATAAEGLTPLYRFFNTQTGAHFFTANEAERDSVIANLPQFTYENVAYYIDLA